MPVMKITEKGKAAFKAGLDGIPPEAILFMEIVTRLPGEKFDTDNIDQVAFGLIKQFGSVDGAIEAIKTGIVEFRKEDEVANERRN